MNLSLLKKFAQTTRNKLIRQVESRLDWVLSHDDEYLRYHEKEKEYIKARFEKGNKNYLIEEVAYIWFNRFTSLRFMDNRNYNPVKIISPQTGETQPELLSVLKSGEIPSFMSNNEDRQYIKKLLHGQIKTNQPDREIYKTALLSYCNYLGNFMPFLFKRIDDWIALLLPTDILSSRSVIADFQKNISGEDCTDVEIIGWLYQFYISEKKERVFADRKKNIKITPENIPAATQLFTPHWIVRYLAENSLGRLWLQNHPESGLIEKMEYYVKGDEETGEYIKLSSPEDIKICDPACGSGHMLVYTFDLLFSIYEEQGYMPVEIPEKIITSNLFGIEIDERAGSLASFALCMKAREKDRRFFEKEIIPNICVLENIEFSNDEIKQFSSAFGDEIFTYEMLSAMKQFEGARNLGSLITPELGNTKEVMSFLESIKHEIDIGFKSTYDKLVTLTKQCDFLKPKYHIVMANPPYMGSKGMNDRLKNYIKNKYSNYKSDLFSCFIIKCIDLCKANGITGIMSPFVWMFLSSYENLRKKIINNYMLHSLIKPSYTAFFQSAIVPICTFVIIKSYNEQHYGYFYDLGYLGNAEEQPIRFLEAKSNSLSKMSFRVKIIDFKKIPGSPIAYWVSDQIRKIFETTKTLKAVGHCCSGIQTGNNDLYLRMWYEISFSKIYINFNANNRINYRHYRWLLHKKGGSYKKWYGNCDYVLDWLDDGYSIKNNKSARPQNLEYMFLPGVTWSHTSSSFFSARLTQKGFSFNVEGPTFFYKYPLYALAYLCSKVTFYIIQIMNPTLHFLVGSVSLLPIIEKLNDNIPSQQAATKQ